MTDTPDNKPDRVGGSAKVSADRPSATLIGAESNFTIKLSNGTPVTFVGFDTEEKATNAMHVPGAASGTVFKPKLVRP